MEKIFLSIVTRIDRLLTGIKKHFCDKDSHSQEFAISLSTLCKDVPFTCCSCKSDIANVLPLKQKALLKTIYFIVYTFSLLLLLLLLLFKLKTKIKKKKKHIFLKLFFIFAILTLFAIILLQINRSNNNKKKTPH